MLWAEIRARDVSVQVAELSLQIARIAKIPLSCNPVMQLGCMRCGALEKGIEERARVLARSPFAKECGADCDRDLGSAKAQLEFPDRPTGSSVAFEPWCHYELIGPPSKTLRMHRDAKHDSKGCEAYLVERGGEVLVMLKACDDRNRPEPDVGMPTEHRLYRWELPQGRFTFNLSFILGEKWRLAGRLVPWDALQFPQAIDFESTRALGGTLLQDTVAFTSAIRFHPTACDNNADAYCNRCARIMATRERVQHSGIFTDVRGQ
jgi:hypothetical protein